MEHATRKLVSCLLILSVTFALVSCDAQTKKTKHKEKRSKKNEIRVDDVIEVCEEFNSALVSLDMDKISELSSDFVMDEFDELLACAEYNESGFDSVFEEVEFEIDEDKVDLDDDEASAEVEFFYLDEEDLSGDKKHDKFTIEFDIDDDRLIVSNSNQVTDKFYYELFDLDDFKTENVEIEEFNYDSVMIHFVDDIITTEEVDVLSFEFDCENYPQNDDARIDVTLNDIEVGFFIYESGATIYFDVEAADIGLDFFRSDLYELDVWYNDACVDYQSFDLVYEPILSEEQKGYLEGNNYVNDYFGFSFVVPDDYIMFDYTTFDEIDSHEDYGDILFAKESILEDFDDYVDNDVLVALLIDYGRILDYEDFCVSFDEEIHNGSAVITYLDDVICVTIIDHLYDEYGFFIFADEYCIICAVNFTDAQDAHDFISSFDYFG